jgi:hypothetical protein
MGPDSVESLRLATVKAEDELAKLAQDKGEHEQVITETSTSRFRTCSPLFLFCYSLSPSLLVASLPPWPLCLTLSPAFSRIHVNFTAATVPRIFLGHHLIVSLTIE